MTRGAIERQALMQQMREINREPLDLFPGAVVICKVRAYALGHDKGKNRPGILVVQPPGDRHTWKVMGLTTLANSDDGNPRRPILDWQGCGLEGPGYLWGPRLPFIPDIDITQVIGRVSADDAEQVLSMLDAQLAPADLDAFLAGVNPETV